MLGLLGFPDFAQSLIADFVFSNLSDLRVKIFKLLPLGVGWDFDRSFAGHERDFEISIFVGRTVKNGADPLANRHVVCAPIGIEQNAVAIFRAAIRKRDE